jgi:hypothetical protein
VYGVEDRLYGYESRGGSTWREETGFIAAEKYASGRCFYKRLAPSLLIYIVARLYFHEDCLWSIYKYNVAALN